MKENSLLSPIIKEIRWTLHQYKIFGIFWNNNFGKQPKTKENLRYSIQFVTYAIFSLSLILQTVRALVLIYVSHTLFSNIIIYSYLPFLLDNLAELF